MPTPSSRWRAAAEGRDLRWACAARAHARTDRRHAGLGIRGKCCGRRFLCEQRQRRGRGAFKPGRQAVQGFEHRAASIAVPSAGGCSFPAAGGGFETLTLPNAGTRGAQRASRARTRPTQAAPPSGARGGALDRRGVHADDLHHRGSAQGDEDVVSQSAIRRSRARLGDDGRRLITTP